MAVKHADDEEDDEESGEYDPNAAGYQDMMDPEGSLTRFVELGYKFVTTDATKGMG